MFPVVVLMMIVDKEMRFYWALIVGELRVALPGFLPSVMTGGRNGERESDTAALAQFKAGAKSDHSGEVLHIYSLYYHVFNGLLIKSRICASKAKVPIA